MRPWSWHRSCVLFLAVWLGLSMSLSLVRSSVMAAEMAVAADRGHHGPSDCNGCGGGDHKSAGTGSCLSVCGSGAQGLVPGELLMLPSASRTGFQVAHLLVSGQSPSPGHGPPKILTLG
jgi:hypothetical protein